MVKDTGAANDRCLELLDLAEPRVVLEIGFGQGRTVAKLIGQGHCVIGAEVSATMVNQATARNRRACRDGRAELLRGDGKLLPFADGSADMAFTTHTIYFMPEPQATLAEAARVLRPGGRLVIACRVGDDKMPEWMDPDVYRIPTIEETTTMLGAAGFIDVCHTSGGTPLQETNWFTAHLP